MPALNQAEFEDIFRRDWMEMWPLMAEAQRLRERHFGRQVSFCVITNAKSGLCSEDLF
ncbi:MAG: hypothetical protein HY743_11035 [Deltaproteobacteria bacterium]|nr:hypothetical protein [Deltaproteobacteria bacterium]